ncbi:disulfide bond formation protein DsbA [Limnohabitans sp. MMS-10A-160]|jgi:thiol:disulfide interchange protein DsbA|uniref:thiol:disulfide interchange protein DsbA/DsbL n=1 Tax=unclassified Limnohabitans TaxID=2626134 RepID=UPI000D338177|nr:MULTISPECIES: thiol:disulfide interchange protein DsbA/DsbL [unclassified Limnohabitans]PUE15650.1 disulfide bond formation protein DsbA [Limnohabitans sp. MMS-10A-192]PUE23564.1 disulfide bond formation protein DsbA [Limnohabitans sp. MMS-10A-160]
MKRRLFSGALLATSAWLSQSTAWAQALFKAGKDYLPLERPVSTDAAAGKIELIEFFWYSCPHCSAFEPTFAQWVKNAPKDVVVRRVPVAFRDDFAPQQRLFFALEAMNLLDSLHAKVFTAIHAEKQPLNTEAAILDWVAKQGVDKAKFSETYKSFGVASKLKRAVQLQNDYKVEGVPSFGIAGRFYTDGSIAGSMERAIKVAESLIAQSRTRT